MVTNVVFIHVLAGLLLVGTSFGSPIAQRALQRAPTAGELRACLAINMRLTRANPLFALVLLGSGIYLGSEGWWSTGWFWVSIASWLASSLLAELVTDRAQAALAASLVDIEGDVPAEADRLRRRSAWEHAEQAILAGDLSVLYLMIAKPSGPVSIALVALTMAIFAAVTEARRRRLYRAPLRPGERVGTA